MSAPKEPPCPSCVLASKAKGRQTAIALLATAIEVRLLTPFGELLWRPCERHAVEWPAPTPEDK